MQISREYALKEMEGARDALVAWIKELSEPEVLNGAGKAVPAYPNGVPEGLSVERLEGIPVAQLKAELMAIAAKLEALAVT